MAIEQSIFEGRRGQKRLKLIEKQKESVLGEFTTGYENSQEMRSLRQDVRWEGMAELMLAMAMRNVHFAWGGLRDYGFLKLCLKWIDEAGRQVDAAGLKTMTNKDAEDMIRSILPDAMWEELNDEIQCIDK